MKAWEGLTKAEYDELKYLKGRAELYQKQYDKKKEAIENRHLEAEQELEATLGRDLTSIKERIASLEAKKEQA